MFHDGVVVLGRGARPGFYCVTDKLEPNDVDCVLLIGPDFPRDATAEAELLAGLPFINMELVDPAAFQQFTERTFATDRNLVPKGMVEVVP